MRQEDPGPTERIARLLGAIVLLLTSLALPR
jgi:hypothetical protein